MRRPNMVEWWNVHKHAETRGRQATRHESHEIRGVDININTSPKNKILEEPWRDMRKHCHDIIEEMSNQDRMNELTSDEEARASQVVVRCGDMS